jgi:hypothetical protein
MKIKFVFLQTLLILGIATLLAYAGKVATVPAADGSQNVNELNGIGITVKTTGGDGTATLSTTVQGDSTTYTGNPQAIPSSDFPIDTTTDVVATVTHIPCTPDKPVTFHVKSQKPTAPLVYVSCASVSAGGSFTFTVNDQNTPKNPIKNAPSLWLFESTPAVNNLYLKDSSGNNAVGPINFSALTNVEAEKIGTDSSGNVTDTPVGFGISGLQSAAISMRETLTVQSDVMPHTYTAIENVVSGTSGTAYTMNFTQNQHVLQTATYNSTDNTATVSTTSVSVGS